MIKPIITNIYELKKPCIEVQKEEDIIQIIQDLKDTFNSVKAYGISANQIGYNKKISYIKIPGEEEIVLINPQIIEKEEKIINRKESCLSFPNVYIDCDRWNQITITTNGLSYQKYVCYGLEAIILQHEIDHLNGITIFDRKHKAR